MKNWNYRKTPLSASIALALSMCALPHVYAQDDGAEENEGMVEEVVVTGVRRSLIESMDRKRNATGVVDAITAEDIGDFPDTNLAEAL